MKKTIITALCLILTMSSIYPYTADDFDKKVLANDLEGIKAIIQSGVDINAKTKYGSTVLLAASMTGRTEIVRYLIEAGADVNVKDKHGYTSLRYAVIFGHTEIAYLLRQAGARQ